MRQAGGHSAIALLAGHRPTGRPSSCWPL